MDENFLQELDKHVSFVNTDKVWKREVGSHVLWISPIDFTQQAKVYEVLQKSPAENSLMETKRTTLANAIVGIDDYDLRPYRYSGKSFKVQRPDGKTEAVDLAGYLYSKMSRWDSEYIDVAFDVFADLMETHKRETVGNLKFDNMKSPREELLELEAKAAVLRERLSLPPLVEKGSDGASGPLAEDDHEEYDRENVEAESGFDESFNPFEAKVVEEQPEPAPPPPAKSRAPRTIEEPAWPATDVSTAVPVPLPPGPAMSPIDIAMASRQAAPRPVSAFDGIAAHPATPSVSSDVVEKPAARVVAAPPTVSPSPATQSRNPRFVRPSR